MRPLAEAIDSSPRVLLYLFGSKDGLVRALLARARNDELAMLDRLRELDDGQPPGLAMVTERLWSWLVAAEHRPLLALWLEGYSRSLIEPGGPWSGFARATVEDWLGVLAEAQRPEHRHTNDGEQERTRALAVLRGSLLDLLATGDEQRTTAALRAQITAPPGESFGSEL